MNIQDFCFTWRGQQQGHLLKKDAHFLKPIDIRGQGREHALLLLHGFSSTPAVFRAMLPELTGYDAVVCPVLPGHADSILSFSKATACEWMSAAELACEALLKEYTFVDVLGLSLGGLLACHLSHRFALNRLYLLAPAIDLRLNLDLSLVAARILTRLGFRRLRNRAGNLHTDHYRELTYRQLPIASIIEILTLVQNFQFMPPDCPTDVFLGCFDEVVDSTKVACRFENIPSAKIHWLENSAHILPLDGDIEIILGCIGGSSVGLKL